MAKIKIIGDYDGVKYLGFMCPACKEVHQISWKKDSDTWTFDENFEAPTITPSIRVTYGQNVCHTWITKGKVKFFDDCTHEMKGQRWIELPEIN